MASQPDDRMYKLRNLADSIQRMETDLMMGASGAGQSREVILQYLPQAKAELAALMQQLSQEFMSQTMGMMPGTPRQPPAEMPPIAPQPRRP